MDDEPEFNLADEVMSTLAAVAEHDYQTTVGVKGILDGSLTEGLDLTAEQRLTLVEKFIAESDVARQPIAERMMFTQMMFD